MPLLTIFTAPKPFTNPHIATIQRNAIQSWLHLGDKVEALLIGDEAGLAEVATELGVRHLPDVRCNQQRTPLVSSIFELARQASQSPLLAYLNADIMVMPDFVTASQKIASQADRFLIVGQRWDLEVKRELDFSPEWDKRLRDEVRSRGEMHAPAGSDYFVFPRSSFSDMPDFSIGRAGWDNWAIYHAVSQGWAVVDITPSVIVIHQNHDYSHLPGGQPHYNLEESFQNQELAGGIAHMYMVLDTNKQLVHGKLRPPRPNLLRVLRKIEVGLMPKGERKGTWWALARKVRRFRRAISGTL